MARTRPLASLVTSTLIRRARPRISPSGHAGCYDETSILTLGERTFQPIRSKGQSSHPDPPAVLGDRNSDIDSRARDAHLTRSGRVPASTPPAHREGDRAAGVEPPRLGLRDAVTAFSLRVDGRRRAEAVAACRSSCAEQSATVVVGELRGVPDPIRRKEGAQRNVIFWRCGRPGQWVVLQ